VTTVRPRGWKVTVSGASEDPHVNSVPENDQMTYGRYVQKRFSKCSETAVLVCENKHRIRSKLTAKYTRKFVVVKMTTLGGTGGRSPNYILMHSRPSGDFLPTWYQIG